MSTDNSQNAEDRDLHRDFEENMGLPPLTGSSKQVSWARDIRMKFLDGSEKYLQLLQWAEDKVATGFGEWIRGRSTQWWIGNRGAQVHDIQEMYRLHKKHERSWKKVKRRIANNERRAAESPRSSCRRSAGYPSGRRHRLRRIRGLILPDL